MSQAQIFKKSFEEVEEAFNELSQKLKSLDNSLNDYNSTFEEIFKVNVSPFIEQRGITNDCLNKMYKQA